MKIAVADAPVTQSGPDASDAIQLDDNMSFSEIASKINDTGDASVPEGARDVRNEPMTQEEVDELEAEQGNAQTATESASSEAVPRARPPVPPQTAAALAIGKHNLTQPQAERLAKILDEGGFDFLDAMWGSKDEMWQKLHGAVQDHYRQSNAMRNEGRKMMEQGQALLAMAKQMFGQNVNQQQAPAPRAETIPDDPIEAAVFKAIQPLNSRFSEIERRMAQPSAYENHTITDGWDQLREKFGDSFNDAIATVADGADLKRNPYTGEYDLSALTPAQAFKLQNGLVRYDKSKQENRKNFDTWYADAVKDLKHLPRSRSMVKSFWAQIMEDSQNDVPITPQRFRSLALQLEAERRQEIGETAMEQAKVRSSAEQPIVPNAGAATPTSGGTEKEDFDYWKDGGNTVDFSAIGKRIIAQSRVPRTRR